MPCTLLYWGTTTPVPVVGVDLDDLTHPDRLVKRDGHGRNAVRAHHDIVQNCRLVAGQHDLQAMQPHRHAGNDETAAIPGDGVEAAIKNDDGRARCRLPGCCVDHAPVNAPVNAAGTHRVLRMRGAEDSRAEHDSSDSGAEDDRAHYVGMSPPTHGFLYNPERQRVPADDPPPISPPRQLPVVSLERAPRRALPVHRPDSSRTVQR